MNATLQDEHKELGANVRRFLAAKSTEEAVREHMGTEEGFDPKLWRQMADQLGMQGMIIPEQYGGSGFGLLELAVVMEELGRALACAPYFSTVALAVNALMASGDVTAQARWLPGIAAGDTIATLAPGGPCSGKAALEPRSTHSGQTGRGC